MAKRRCFPKMSSSWSLSVSSPSLSEGVISRINRCGSAPTQCQDALSGLLEFESRLRCPSVGTLPKRGQTFYYTSQALSSQSGKFRKNNWIPPCIS